jgi:hypothetical protein
MIRFLALIAATLAYLLPFGTARADDFVLLSGYTQTAFNTCYAGLTNNVFSSHCDSTVYLFNQDTSDIYICTSALLVDSFASTGQITNTQISAACVKTITAFSLTSKYTAVAHQNSNAVPGIQHQAIGTAFWVSVNTSLHVRACFNLILPVKYAGCDDATIQ